MAADVETFEQAGLAAYFFALPELQSNWHEGAVAMDILNFMKTNAEVRNDNPFTDGMRFGVSPKPNAEDLIVPFNLALNEYDLPKPPKLTLTNWTPCQSLRVGNQGSHRRNEALQPTPRSSSQGRKARCGGRSGHRQWPEKSI